MTASHPTPSVPASLLLPSDCSDGNMPVMDGLELTRRLRAGGVRAPIVAVTGNALQEDQAAFIEAGASAVLTKPSTTAKLQETLAGLGARLPGSPGIV